jgi:hypothetical protein
MPPHIFRPATGVCPHYLVLSVFYFFSTDNYITLYMETIAETTEITYLKDEEGL